MSINRKFSRLRLNPSLGMPGMPHTWVTRKGVHVSGGDLIEFWTGRADLGQRRKATATVNKALVFGDHVMVNRGTWGSYVDDANFIRVVRRAGSRRSNPTSGPTVAIRVYFRGRPDGEILHIPARFFRWHPAYHGRKSYASGGSSLGGKLERARDAYVDKIAPGNVGWEEVYSSTHYEKASRNNPSRRTFADWNWGTGPMSAEARRVWPDKQVFAIVWTAGLVGTWHWEVKHQFGGRMPGRSKGIALSSNAAKSAATAYVSSLVKV